FYSRPANAWLSRGEVFAVGSKPRLAGQFAETRPEPMVPRVQDRSGTPFLVETEYVTGRIPKGGIRLSMSAELREWSPDLAARREHLLQRRLDAIDHDVR